ncbi:MAG: ABC transporter permease subunit [Rhizomicrobium sp.]
MATLSLSRARFSSAGPIAARAISPVLIVLAWQAASSAGLIPERTLASPLHVLGTFGMLIADGELVNNLLVSLRRAMEGLAIGTILGTVFALIAGLSKRGEAAIDAPLQIVRAVPFLALVPLFILWFGIGETPKIALVALGTVYPIYLNLYAGIRGIDKKLLEAGRAFGLNRWQILRHVVLPGALPAFLIGLRYAMGISWLSLVVAEQINASSGIGYLIMTARDFMRTDIIVVGLMVYGLLGLLTDVIIRALEHYALAWRPSILKD